MLVIGGEVRRNPLFVPTDEFLPEYRQRRRTRRDSRPPAQ
jgi:hypothetical protein